METLFGSQIEYYKSQIRYNISYNLSHCTSDNNITQIQYGESYQATITPDIDYTLEGGTIEILMNNIDITSQVYNNGIINISRVTGNLSINISAKSTQTSFDYIIDFTDTSHFSNGSLSNFGPSSYDNYLYISVVSSYTTVPALYPTASTAPGLRLYGTYNTLRFNMSTGYKITKIVAESYSSYNGRLETEQEGWSYTPTDTFSDVLTLEGPAVSTLDIDTIKGTGSQFRISKMTVTISID